MGVRGLIGRTICVCWGGGGGMGIFWNHTIEIALIQYSGQLKHAWAFSETAKKFPKSPVQPDGCELWRVYHVYFLFSGFITGFGQS